MSLLKGIAASLCWLSACAPHAAAPQTPAPTDCASEAPAASTPVVATPPRGDGLPEIPDELRRSLAPYLSVRSASLQSIADDGKSILISTRFGDTYQVHHVGQPLGARTQITFGREPVSSPSFVPGASKEFSFAMDSGGNERFQLYVGKLDGGGQRMLTDGLSRNKWALWSDDGSKLAYSSNQRNGTDMDVYVRAGGEAPATLVYQGPGTYLPIDWSSDGKRLLVMQYVSATETHLHVVDLEAKAATTITPPSPATAYLGSVFGKRPEHVYVSSTRDGEFNELFLVNTTKNVWKSLTASLSWDVEDVAISADGATVALAVNEGGFSALYLMGTVDHRLSRVDALPKGIVSGLSFARRAPVLAFTLSEPTNPSDAYSYDLRRRKLTRWTESETGGLSRSTFVAPTVVEVDTFDGRKVPSLYYAPKSGGPHPVVIQFHGGPEAQARPYFGSLTQYLVTRLGVAVLQPNVRGSRGYGKTYMGLDDGALRHDAVRDVGALLDWVAAQPNLDRQRVAVEGGSYGGFMVLASLVGYGDRIAAGIDMVGISNFVTFLENTEEYRRDIRRKEYGDERDPAMRQYLASVSPITHADRIRSPLFVAQGANDPRVPRSEAEQIVRAVRERGHSVWYQLAEDEGHGFQKRRNSDKFRLHAIQFLTQHLSLVAAGGSVPTAESAATGAPDTNGGSAP